MLIVDRLSDDSSIHRNQQECNKTIAKPRGSRNLSSLRPNELKFLEPRNSVGRVIHKTWLDTHLHGASDGVLEGEDFQCYRVNSAYPTYVLVKFQGLNFENYDE